MPARESARALDHIVVVLFENRSLENMLGHLYGPEDGKNFDGVIGQNLSNPIPEWAEHGADKKVVPYTVATDMDAPTTLRPGLFLHPIRTRPPASLASSSTSPATGCPRSSSLPGSRKAPCSTTSSAIPR